MVDLRNIKGIYLSCETKNYRMGISGLTEVIRTTFPDVGREHNLFIFFSKNKQGIKMIEFDNEGTWLYQHKLAHGRYQVPIEEDGKIQIDIRQLKIILKSIKLIAKRKVRNLN